MKSPATTRRIIETLAALYPGADTELHHRNAFELLVATMLSAQSTDARVNLVTPALFARYPDARALAGATPAELEPQILSTGFFRQKSKALVTMAQILVRDHRGQVPADMEALTKLPGVGRKTANVVLGHALGVPGLPVDRHVLRVANRIGIAEGDDPVAVETQLCARLPPSLWTLASDVQILHGRRICRPTKPLCDQCPVADDCLYFAALSRETRGAAPAARSKPTGARKHGPKAPVTRAKDLGCRAGPAPQVNRAMTRAAFERLVTEAITLIPRRFRAEMRNIAIVVEDEPSADTLAAMEIEPPDSLYGLYEGTPLPERQWAFGNHLPDRVTIFQRPIEEDCDDEDDVRAVIGETLIHEIGHYFGLSEEEIEEIEERYWRGETLGPDEDDEP